MQCPVPVEQDWGHSYEEAEISAQVDWWERPQVTIRKNFYEECAKEAAVSRSSEEVEWIRQSNKIEILDGCSDQHPVPNVINSFDEVCFPEDMMALLRDRFEEPTPIQKQIWPLALEGRDVVGIAETGFGKTEAYLLPMICHIFHQEELEAGDGPIALVLASTRKLAMQIQEKCELFGWLKDLKSCTVVGGIPSSQQREHLEERNHILVATPGHFMNALEEGWVVLNRASYVILDEADQMLSKEDFYEQIKQLLEEVRKERQVLMFSTSWREEMCSFAKEICTDSEGMPPVFVRIGGDKLAACKDIEQHTVLVDGDEDKYAKLKERLRSPETFGDGGRAIIFCRTPGAVMQLHEKLSQEEWHAVGMLHGRMLQSDRDRVRQQFHRSELPCVISTGVLARGYDIPKLKTVVVYDLPRAEGHFMDQASCAQRSGATGLMIFINQSQNQELQSAHDYLMGVLRAADQTVEEDLKEAVENYERSQNQGGTEGAPAEAAGGDAAQEQYPEATQRPEWQEQYGQWSEGTAWQEQSQQWAQNDQGTLWQAGWQLWQQEAAGGDASQEQYPEATQRPEWQEQSHQWAQNDQGTLWQAGWQLWQQEALGWDASQEQYPEDTRRPEWQEQYGQWSEGTAWQEQSHQWAQNDQGTLWQAGWQQEALGWDASQEQYGQWSEGTAWQEQSHQWAQNHQGTLWQAGWQQEAAGGDASQDTLVLTRDSLKSVLQELANDDDFVMMVWQKLKSKPSM